MIDKNQTDMLNDNQNENGTVVNNQSMLVLDDILIATKYVENSDFEDSENETVTMPLNNFSIFDKDKKKIENLNEGYIQIVKFKQCCVCFDRTKLEYV
jgi:hypothetical protein